MASLKERITTNRSPCSAPGCRSPRWRVSNFCAKHWQRNRHHGHPLGRRIEKQEYAKERKEVAEFIRTHAGHTGLTTGIEWLAKLLRDAAEAPAKTPGQVQLARLHRCAIEPVRVLVECAALWLFAVRNPQTLPDDIRLDHALGACISFLIPREQLTVYRYPSGLRRRYQEVLAGS